MRSAVEQPVQLLGLVRAVGVHLDEDVVPVGQGVVERGEVRRPQALLAGPVQDPYLLVGRRQGVGEPAGAVGAVVVGHEDVGLGHGRADPPDDALDVLPLVVRRHDHDDPAEVGEGCCAHGTGSWVGSGSVERTSIARRCRSPVAMARPSAASAAAVATHSGIAPTRSATVIVSRRGTLATR